MSECTQLTDDLNELPETSAGEYPRSEIDRILDAREKAKQELAYMSTRKKAKQKQKCPRPSTTFDEWAPFGSKANNDRHHYPEELLKSSPCMSALPEMNHLLEELASLPSILPKRNWDIGPKKEVVILDHCDVPCSSRTRPPSPVLFGTQRNVRSNTEETINTSITQLLTALRFGNVDGRVDNCASSHLTENLEIVSFLDCLRHPAKRKAKSTQSIDVTASVLPTKRKRTTPTRTTPKRMALAVSDTNIASLSSEAIVDENRSSGPPLLEKAVPNGRRPTRQFSVIPEEMPVLSAASLDPLRHRMDSAEDDVSLAATKEKLVADMKPAEHPSPARTSPVAQDRSSPLHATTNVLLSTDEKIMELLMVAVSDTARQEGVSSPIQREQDSTDSSPNGSDKKRGRPRKYAPGEEPIIVRRTGKPRGRPRGSHGDDGNETDKDDIEFDDEIEKESQWTRGRPSPLRTSANRLAFRVGSLSPRYPQKLRSRYMHGRRSGSDVSSVRLRWYNQLVDALRVYYFKVPATTVLEFHNKVLANIHALAVEHGLVESDYSISPNTFDRVDSIAQADTEDQENQQPSTSEPCSDYSADTVHPADVPSEKQQPMSTTASDGPLSPPEEGQNYDIDDMFGLFGDVLTIPPGSSGADFAPPLCSAGEAMDTEENAFECTSMKEEQVLADQEYVEHPGTSASEWHSGYDYCDPGIAGSYMDTFDDDYDEEVDQNEDLDVEQAARAVEDEYCEQTATPSALKHGPEKSPVLSSEVADGDPSDDPDDEDASCSDGNGRDWRGPDRDGSHAPSSGRSTRESDDDDVGSVFTSGSSGDDLDDDVIRRRENQPRIDHRQNAATFDSLYLDADGGPVIHYGEEDDEPSELRSRSPRLLSAVKPEADQMSDVIEEAGAVLTEDPDDTERKTTPSPGMESRSTTNSAEPQLRPIHTLRAPTTRISPVTSSEEEEEDSNNNHHGGESDLVGEENLRLDADDDMYQQDLNMMNDPFQLRSAFVPGVYRRPCVLNGKMNGNGGITDTGSSQVNGSEPTSTPPHPRVGVASCSNLPMTSLARHQPSGSNEAGGRSMTLPADSAHSAFETSPNGVLSLLPKHPPIKIKLTLPVPSVRL